VIDAARLEADTDVAILGAILDVCILEAGETVEVQAISC